MSSRPQHYADSPEYKHGHDEALEKLEQQQNVAPCAKSRHTLCKVRECNYCDEEYQHGQDDDYCSIDCKYNGIAYDALRRARRDHTHCISCFRRLKTLIPAGREHFETSTLGTPHKTDQLTKDLPTYGPPDHENAISVGGITAYEHPEPCYQWDIGEQFRANPTEGDWEFTPQAVKSTKVCTCGVAHHGTAEYLKKDLSVAAAVRRTERLTDILTEYQKTEDWEHEYDTDELFAVVKALKNDEQERASGKDFEIFERALGRAVKAAEYAP